MNCNISELEIAAKRVRQRMLSLSYSSGASTHLGGGLSLVEILVLMYGSYLKHDPKRPSWSNRDRLILSKGHGVLGYFAVLHEFGYITADELSTFMQNGSRLIAHPIAAPDLGIESSNGSLGHGLSFGSGLAWALSRKESDAEVVVVLGDGECQEGSVWEAAACASDQGLKNLLAIVDCNGFQSDGKALDSVHSKQLAAKWTAFGWDAWITDGHDVTKLQQAFKNSKLSNGPRVVIAKTVKGKGISFMENDNSWHHNRLTKVLYDKAMEELSK